ncbi:MAG: hypothetical protein QM775_05750 [Pirellulales bacterium]
MLLAPTLAFPAPDDTLQPRGRAADMSPEQERSIERGIDWLLGVMNRDGGVGPDLDRPAELGCTAIVGLALLSEGNTPRGGPHYRELRRVLHAVLDILEHRSTPKVNYEQTLVQHKIGRNADLFIAAIFLTQVYGEAPDDQEDIRRALVELVATICSAQNSDGTWGEESWAPVLGTVLGWEGLRAASSCGLRVDASARLAGESLFKQLRDKREDPRGLMHNFYKTAASIRVLHSMGYRDDPVFKDCVTRLLRDARSDSPLFTVAGGEEYLAFFFVTECLLKDPDKAWQAWYPDVCKNLVELQNTDGSWSGHHCITGRTFCTAAALLTLQACNFCLPISEL